MKICVDEKRRLDDLDLALLFYNFYKSIWKKE